jgi:hypothetical protein
MTSFRQFEANRQNARRSTGPNTDEGKRRSRRNAVRHGLCAETVIEIVEDVEDYKGFEAAVIADYEAHTAVERELVLRLASLLWRIRRATSIETDLMRVQAEILRDRRSYLYKNSERPPKLHSVLLEDRTPSSEHRDTQNSNGDPCTCDCEGHNCRSAHNSLGSPRDLTYCFQRLTNLDNGALDRLGRYETALWRQIVQTLLVLHPLRRR